MEARVEGLISMLQGLTDKSVAVGFGVSRPEQVRALAGRGGGGWLAGRAWGDVYFVCT